MKAQTIVIIANGTVKNKNFHLESIHKADLIICADGGANTARDLNVIPDIIIGDLDSITSENLKFFKEQKETKIIDDPDQNKTDMELAISLAETYFPAEIIILGGIGSRIDHTLANIFQLVKVAPQIDAYLKDEHNEIRIIQDSISLTGKKDDIISTLSLTQAESVSYDGLHWDLQNKSLPPLWVGICNKMTGNSASISLGNGLLLVIKSTD